MAFNDYRDNDLEKYRVFSGGIPPASTDTNMKIGRQDPTYVSAVVTTTVPTASGTVLRTNYR